ncbi:MAG: cell division protein FtsX [Bacteroidota bacterium]
MSLRFAVSEGISGLRRATAMTVVSIGTVAIVLLLLGSFALVVLNVESLFGSIRSQMELEVFLRDEVDSTAAVALGREILSLGGVANFKYVSKTEALRIFREEFGQDISKVLTFNPLPASLKIRLLDSALTASRVQRIVRQIRSLQGVEDIAYPRAVIETVESRARDVVWLSIAVGVLLLLASLFLVSNTVRLAMYSRRLMIRLLLLAGATRGFIRGPFLVEGFFQGFIGGVLGAVFLKVGIDAMTQHLLLGLPWGALVPLWFYGIVVAVGTLLGLIGSALSVRSYLRETTETE